MGAQGISGDAYDEFSACTTGNRTVLHRGYSFARSNIYRTISTFFDLIVMLSYHQNVVVFKLCFISIFYS